MRFSLGRPVDPDAPPKTDAGSGKLADYSYDLAPKRSSAVIRLARTDPSQDELARILSLGIDSPEAFIARRTIEDERVDAPMPVRLFVEARPTGVVGWVPRGLEGVVEAALSRWEEREGKVRLPAAIVKTRHGLRVELQIGATK